MNPSARPNAVTEPEPFPIGIATSDALVCGTRPTRTYSVRPRSEFTRAGIVAATVDLTAGGRPASDKSTGAMNS